MGQMPTFNADGWQPVKLVSPDGRTYTPGDHTEHRQLLASGYREAPAESSPPVPDVAAASAAADDPDVKLAFDTQPARDAAESAAESAAVATAAADAPKPKTSRRNGGAQ
ncbi:hypothetical protein GS490_15700 [Rhodococcus hoagii]|nr:hypothetical protein [Prescottella equi]NKS17762.1 hypothetical protein [Prescottella equi]